jgi:tRNA (guanine37-N1)-methyltransferase
MAASSSTARRSARSPTCSTCRHGDVLVVRRERHGREVLVPFVKAMVPVVDVGRARLQVDPPEGLLDVDAPRRPYARRRRHDLPRATSRRSGSRLLGKAQERGLLEVRVHDLRTWTSDVHRTVDDSPVRRRPRHGVRPEPVGQALDAVLAAAGPSTAPVLLVPTPSGRPFTQALAQELAAEPWLAFACGRYEGIDARVLEDAAARFRVVEVSLGDYVLAGGEVAVLVVVEAVARLLPGVLGNAESHRDDSFAPGGMESLLEGPVYTRPQVWRDREVPAVLQSGDHARIARWRRDEALRRTAARRPDLLVDRQDLDRRDREVLDALP